MRVCVTGAGGFIATHLCRRLRAEGHWVRGVDIKYPEWDRPDTNEFLLADLREAENARRAMAGGIEWVFALAANMGGIGYIANPEGQAKIIMDNTLISVNTIRAAAETGVMRYFFSSSACAYPDYLQQEVAIVALKESDVYPAAPQDAYGWEKLHCEHLCRYVRECGRLETRVARFHNIYGPCFDEETEVLTKSGFKRFRDISGQDEIATRGQDGCIEYHKPIAIQRYFYRGKMYHIKQQRVDLLITPDHSVFYAKRRSNSPFCLAKIADILSEKTRLGTRRKAFFFTRQASWGTSVSSAVNMETIKLPEVHYSDGRSMVNRCGKLESIPIDDWLRFIGWYLTEGSAFVTPSNYTVCITQGAGRYQDEIVELIKRIGFRPYVNGGNVIMSSKQLYTAVAQFGGAAEKYIPRAFLFLGQPKLQILFDTLMKGDGHADGSQYSTVSKQLADDVQELALKLGYGVQISKEAQDSPRLNDVYRVHICDETVHKIYAGQIREVKYSGCVYDVTVPNHTILVRRNGCVVWSGNCGTWHGGKEKLPAAACRKVAVAKLTGDPRVEVWGDGKQTRSFCYVDDCVEMVLRLMGSDYSDPMNVGTDRLASVDEVFELAARAAGIQVELVHVPGSQGVRGRNADLALMREQLGYEPQVSLEDGLRLTYNWVEQQVRSSSEVA